MTLQNLEFIAVKQTSTDYSDPVKEGNLYKYSRTVSVFLDDAGMTKLKERLQNRKVSEQARDGQKIIDDQDAEILKIDNVRK